MSPGPLGLQELKILLVVVRFNEAPDVRTRGIHQVLPSWSKTSSDVLKVYSGCPCAPPLNILIRRCLQEVAVIEAKVGKGL